MILNGARGSVNLAFFLFIGVNMDLIAVENKNEIIDAGQNFQTLYDRFCNYVDVNSGKTLITYRNNLKPFFRFLTINQISLPTRDDVKAYKDHLIQQGKKPATIKSYVGIVKIFFNFLEDEGLYKNVAKKVKSPKVAPGHRSDFLNAEQLANLFHTIENSKAGTAKRDFIMVNLMVALALRTIEVERANVGHLHDKDGATYLEIHGKGGKVVDRKLDANVAAMLREYLATRSNLTPDSPLFVSEAYNHSSDGRILARTFSSIIKKYMRMAGIDSERITAHSLRHSAAMLKLKASDNNIMDTMTFLRHSSPTVTMTYVAELDATKDTSSSDVMSLIKSALK